MTTDSSVDSGGHVSTEDTMRERANESRVKLWLLLRANRLVVTAVLATLVFVLFVAVGTVGFPEFHTKLRTGDTVDTMFSALLGAIITGTTLVVTINQVVISQENGPLGDQHERMSSAMDFRNYTGDLIERPTPADPAEFLQAFVDTARLRAEALHDAVAGGDDELQRDVDEFTDSLVGNAETVLDDLDGATFGSFGVLFAALDFNYSWKIFQVERIGHEHDDALSEDETTLLLELRTALSMYGVAREHVKTLYFEWALIDLSRLILYVFVPALVAAGGMVAFVNVDTVSGTTASVSNLLWVVAAAFTVCTLPFLLLLSYILRIATVAKRTLAIGPLVLRDSEE